MVLVLTENINMGRLLAANWKMSNTRINLLFVTLMACLLLSPAHSQISIKPLTGSEIRSALFGKLFTGEYPNGSGWAERFNLDFTSDYSEDNRITRGKMTLNGNILCFTYADIDQSGGCFEVWQRGENCFDFYSPTGNASLDERRFGQGWQARGWQAGSPSTCVSQQIS